MTHEEDLAAVDEWIPGTLTFHERWWVQRLPFLEQSGYAFRPRYQPGWAPSWVAKDWFDDFEDGQDQLNGMLLDARRVSDGTYVFMKRISQTRGKGVLDELEIMQYLTSEPLSSDPRNHSVPILDVLRSPNEDGEMFVVTPMLRPFCNPRFQTFGEAVAFFTQIFEAVEFMHEHHVVHGDCTKQNIMMDPTQIYPESFHPVKRDRRRDWKGKAKHYTLGPPVFGGDKSAPEHQTYDTPCDPFPTDVYYLGSLVRKMFMSQSYEFEFMEPLVADMVQTDPSKRPKMDEVVHQYGVIRDALSTRKLRSRIVWRDEWLIQRLFLNFVHLFRTAKYIITRKAAIPMPPS